MRPFTVPAIKSRIAAMTWRPFRRPKRIAALVLCYDSLEDTKRLVAALRRMPDLDIYVVDNATPGLSEASLAAALPGVIVMRSEANLGYAHGNNLGLQRITARGHEFVWILNPDMEVTEDAPARLAAAADRFAQIDVFGPVIFRGANRERIATAGSFVSLEDGLVTGHILAGKTAADLPDAPYEVDCLTGAALFLRCSALPRLGLIPEHYFLYFEETHWLIAGRRSGVRCMVLPDLHLVHHKVSGAGGLPARHFLYYYVRNFLLFAEWLGVEDPAPTVSRLKQGFIADALRKVARKAPADLALYETLVECALADGLAGRSGKADLPSINL